MGELLVGVGEAASGADWVFGKGRRAAEVSLRCRSGARHNERGRPGVYRLPQSAAMIGGWVGRQQVASRNAHCVPGGVVKCARPIKSPPSRRRKNTAARQSGTTMAVSGLSRGGSHPLYDVRHPAILDFWTVFCLVATRGTLELARFRFERCA